MSSIDPSVSLEIINPLFNQIFSNAAENDIAFYSMPSSSNQAMHFGFVKSTGTVNASTMKMTQSNVEIGCAPAYGYLSCANMSGFKNKIINGDMRIDQRYCGSNLIINVGTGSIGNLNVYSIDRIHSSFTNTTNTGVIRCGQSNINMAVQGMQYAYSVTVMSPISSLGSYDVYRILQHRIEGVNIADLSWGTLQASPVTLSFWCKCTGSFTFNLVIKNGALNRSFITSFSCAPNIWEYKTFTIPGDTIGTWAHDTNAGILIDIILSGLSTTATSGAWISGNFVGLTSLANNASFMQTANNNILITALQFEKGPLPTSFEYRPLQVELNLCKRYYEQSFPLNTSPSNVTKGMVISPIFKGISSTIKFDTPKRIKPPFMTIYNPYINALNSVRELGSNINAIEHAIDTTFVNNVDLVCENSFAIKLTSSNVSNVHVCFGYVANSEF